jgi:hypothetical protein
MATIAFDSSARESSVRSLSVPGCWSLIGALRDQ